MSIFGAMFSAVSGLSAQSQSLAIISDNISNMNTTGYKASTARFSTLVTTQARENAYSSGGVRIHPTQMIDVQGLLEASNTPTDMAINGSGFFIVNSNSDPSLGQIYYTRAGSFTTDLSGNLKNTAGFYLMGWPTDATGALDSSITNTSTTDQLQAINVSSTLNAATATTSVSIGANLPATAAINVSYSNSILLYDALGVAHTVTLTYTKAAENQWNLSSIAPAGGTSLSLKDASGNVVSSHARLDFTAQPTAGDTIVLGGTTYTAGTTYAIGTDIATTVTNFVTAVGDSRVTAGTGSNTSTVFMDQTLPASTTVTATSTGNLNGNLTVDTTSINAPTITVAAAATADQTVTINMRGTTYTVTITNGDSANTVATKIGTAIDASNNVLDASVATNVVTTTVGPALAFDASGTSVVDQSVAGSLAALSGSVPGVTFTGTGVPATNGFNVTQMDIAWSNGASASSGITLDLGTEGLADGLTQFSDQFSTVFIQQNGIPTGTFSSLSIGDDGLINALFDNGMNRPIYQIPLATYTNPNGLTQSTGNVFLPSATSGTPLLNTPGVGPAGKIAQGALEASTVDIAEEFTKMIIAQRAFSAASKTITTADEMLDELVRIKR